MMQVYYNQLVSQQKIWKDTLPFDQYMEFCALSRVLMHQAIDNGNALPEKDLRIPNGFSSSSIFYVVKAFTDHTVKKIEPIGEFTFVSVTN